MKWGPMALIAIPFLVATSARAEWVRILEDNETVNYLDTATITKVDENLRRVSELMDFKIPDPQFKDELSHSFLVEYNCKESLVRVVSVTGYAERMAKGRITNSARPPLKWSRIGPGSHHANQLRIVCAK
jgi:hypothetical protein